ncbi:MAG: ROK family protein [Polyangiaceae bacterium]
MAEARTLAVDIGGIGIKMLVLGPDGTRLTEHSRVSTPSPSTPQVVLERLRDEAVKHAPYDRIAIGFPGVVLHGVVKNAPNLGTEQWAGHDLQRSVEAALECPTLVINDADLQGYGVIAGQGAEMVLTLGTGMGAALFTEGTLFPNLELGHHPFGDGNTYEERISDAVLKDIGAEAWSTRVIETFEQLAPIFNYDTLHLGGGNVRHLTLPLPQGIRVFDNAEGLLGGLRLWERATRS